jgi:hypothetical protein
MAFLAVSPGRPDRRPTNFPLFEPNANPMERAELWRWGEEWGVGSGE